MSRLFVWVLFVTAIISTTSAPLWATTYSVGGCIPKAVNFPTIGAAVVYVLPGTTILVCPGVYPEQVTITQPLTLQGVSYNNMGRPQIIINPNGILTPNVTSEIGQAFYAQILVQNVNPVGPVNITGITIDGARGNLGCNTSNGLAGIFYASNTSGTINQVTTRNQQSSGCGVGISAENVAGPNQNVTIENSSVHDFDSYGINVLSNQNTSTLTATLRGNFLATTARAGLGIFGSGMTGTIADNVTTNLGAGIVSEAYGGPVSVSSNVVADLPAGSDGIILTDSTTATSNLIANASTALYLGNAGPTMKSNTTMNTNVGVYFNCTPGSSATKNVVSDSQTGFLNATTTVLGNAIYNLDTMQSAACP